MGRFLNLLVPFPHNVWRMSWFNSVVVEKVPIWTLETKLHLDRAYLTIKPTYTRHRQQYSQTPVQQKSAQSLQHETATVSLPKCRFAFHFWNKFDLYKNHTMLFSSLPKIQFSSLIYNQRLSEAFYLNN